MGSLISSAFKPTMGTEVDVPAHFDEEVLYLRVAVTLNQVVVAVTATITAASRAHMSG